MSDKNPTEVREVRPSDLADVCGDLSIRERIDRASAILQPFTTHPQARDIVSAVNDAFNLLQWGMTTAEEAEEERDD